MRICLNKNLAFVRLLKENILLFLAYVTVGHKMPVFNPKSHWSQENIVPPLKVIIRQKTMGSYRQMSEHTNTERQCW